MFKKVLFILPVFIALCISVCAESISYDFSTGKVENAGSCAIIKKGRKLYFSGEDNSIVVDLKKGDKITLLKWESYASIKPAGEPAEYTACAIDYMCEGQLIESGVTLLDTEPKFPQLEERIGYEVKWSYDLQGKNYIVANAEYELKTFVAEFVADGEVIDSQEYTIETTELVAPAIPEKSGPRAVWERYEIVPGGMVINARYILEETDAENAEEKSHFTNVVNDLGKEFGWTGPEESPEEESYEIKVLRNIYAVGHEILADIEYGIEINEEHIKNEYREIIKETKEIYYLIEDEKMFQKYVVEIIKNNDTLKYFKAFYNKYFKD